MHKHIVQSPEWAQVKKAFGKKTISAGGAIYTLHPLPKIGYNYAYCPKVNPEDVDFEEVRKSLYANKCIGLSFDVPNVSVGSPEEKKAIEKLGSYCVKADRSEFAQANVILDLSPSEKDLFSHMAPKHRYNTRYALKNGVTVRLAERKEDIKVFYDLVQETAVREHFFNRPQHYYEIIWDILHPKNMCDLIIAEHGDKTLAAWMLFRYENVLYYPYGGSSLENRNLFASNALGWEAIRFGKRTNCLLFDMWGAAIDPSNQNDSYYGFTNFKIKFGGKHIVYVNSYDMVINKPLYKLFKSANSLRWFLLHTGLMR